MKKQKNTVKARIILIFILFFFLLILCCNNKSYARSWGSISALLDGNGYANTNLNIGDTVTGASMDDVFGNKSIYCIEAGQEYVEYKYKYTLKNIIEVDDTTNKDFQPLLYIFANYPKSSFASNSDVMPYFNNASQIALWGTIKAKDLNSKSGYFKAKKCVVENRNYGYASIYTYYAPLVGGGGRYDVQRPYFAIYAGEPSQPRYYGVASTQTRFPNSLGVSIYANDRHKKASHLGYLVYQKATDSSAQKYKGKIYVFYSGTSQNFIIFSKPEKITNPPTITLNLYKKNNAGIKMKNATVEISMNDNIKTINGGKNAIKVSSDSTAGKFGAISIVPTTNNGTVKINLKETIAPSNGIAMSDTVVLTINYNTTTGVITGISTDKNNNYFDFKSATEIDLINPNVPEWYIYKVNQDGNVVKKEVTFETTIAITGGKTYKETYKTNSSTGKTGNIISEAAQKELVQKYMNNKKDVTAKVTIKEQKVEGYGNPVTCNFTLTYNGIKMTASGLDNTQKCTNNNTSTTITIKNIEIKPIWITVKKVDNENKGIGPAKFNVSFVQDGTTTNSNLTIQGTGGVYYNTTTFNPKSYNPITVTIDETEGPAHFNKSDTSVVLQFNWKGKEETGYWEPTIISGKDQLVEFTDSEFSDLTTNKYYPSNSERLIRTDKTATRDFNRSFGLKIRNDTRIIKDTKLYKYDITGDYAVKGAVFTAEFSGVTYVKINGNKINATGNKVTVTGLVSDANGLIANIQEIEAIEKADTVYMTIKETATASGFDILPSEKPAKLVFKYDKTDKSAIKWKLYEAEDNQLPQEFFKIENDKELKLKLKDDYKIDNLNLLKTDSIDGNPVNGAEFKITLENVKSVGGFSAESSGKIVLSNIKTDNGNIALKDIVIKDINKAVTITMEEISAPEGYKKIDGEMYVYITKTDLKNNKYLIKRDKQTSVLEDEFKAGEEIVEGNTISLGINDIPALQELDLIKKDSQDEKKELSDAEFKLTFNNIKYYYINGTKYTDATKDGVKISDGIEKILPDDINQPMTITLVETKAPRGYKRIEGTITLNIKYEDNEQRYSIEATSTGKISEDKEFNASDDRRIENGKNAYVTIKDIPLINIGGIVWEDAQTGNKQISGPDGKLNNGETGISGIGVEIYNEKDERVYQDIYGDKLVDTTAGNGQEFSYKLNNGNSDTISLNAGEYIFPNLEKGEYYVRFLYDGINYMTVDSSNNKYELTSPKESKVTEEGRDAFNARFKTISPGQSNDGTKLGYDYNEAEKTSKLQVGIKGENPANDNEFDFQMKAKSENYLRSGDADWIKVWTEDGKINRDHYALDVNCGLVKKYFDLALGTDVKSARVTINGKEATYDYAKIMNGGLENLDLNEITQNKSSDNDGIEYTLYLYNSDYNFRIKDYRTDMSDKIENKVNEEDNNETAYDVKKELEVYVTYTIVLKNQSKQPGTVEEFVYYYDKKYKDPDINAGDGYTADIDDTNKVITFECTGDGELKEREDNNKCYRKEIEVTFTVDKNNDGSLKLGEFSNAGEITEYSTPNGGFIDYDSAPGNADFDLGDQKTIKGHYEDDCDQAPGLNITVSKDIVRESTGIVFEDSNKDGQNNDDTPVNDVIVQLIELKKIGGSSGKYYEYIWQQTRSGSKEVLTTTRNGYEGKSYNSDATGDGVYQFKDFIPGNYIIRFIYGDGTTYDMNLDGVRKYNGQDYQSTKDAHYKDENYNSANYSEGSSIAVDNEARRLEVMSYSSSIDGGNGTAIEAFIRNLNFDTLTDEEKQNLNKYFNELKDEYNSTRGASPTARIKQIFNDDDMAKGEVDQDIFNKIQRYASWKTWMCAESSNVEVGVKENTSFANMNFGLALRPKTKLSLEKHITALKIKPQGNVQPIVEATIDINDIVKGRDITVSGKKEGLAIIPSTRNERGFWKVETDIEELAQGANVELEYTYVIKNESEPDYLGREIIGNYLTKAGNDSDGDKIDDYATYLSNISESVKKDIKGRRDYYGAYLGYYYYTGDDSKVGPVDSESIDSAVPARVTTIKDYLNNNLKLVSSVERLDFEKSNNSGVVEKTVYDVDGKPKSDKEKIETVISNTERFNELLPKDAKGNSGDDPIDTIDISKKVKVQTILSASNKEISYPAYIGEITKYTSATGRKDMYSTPENLSYVNSEDTRMTLR